jgi:two-component system sensor histidine kinase/response regulator
MNTPNKLPILIIEDSDLLRQSLAEMLELNGFRALVASNGTDGLHVAKRDKPALIITDVNMPGMNGLELLEIFRGDGVLRSIPVIVISAQVDRTAIRRSMELGATDFITKPFTEDEVLHSIATRLENKALLDELEAFAHTVAHDLKNPLATVAGRLEMLGLMLDNADKATVRQQLSEALKSARRLSGIIDELLLLAGVRRQAVVPLPLDMAAVVAESIDRLESILKEQSARIEKPDIWPAAVGHAPWVIQVWVNYISNAAKYGGREPLIKLGAQTNANERYTRFWVEDSGPGLDEEAQTRLFVPFTRISTARARGHGLGLSIVRRIVERLGGNVGVTSRPGAGARFWFELPAGTPTIS